MKCVVCDRVKGKRFCPAKNRQICPKCCGEKRVVEIPCPEDCAYLSSGLSYQLLKKRVNQLQNQEDPARRRKYYEVHERFSQVMTDLEEVIIRYARNLRSLLDTQVKAAVTLVRNTYETEQKGVIYEHTATDPLVNALARDLREFLEGRRQLKEGQVFLKTSEIVDCLAILLEDIDYHLSEGESEGSYLQFIAKSRPDIARTPAQRLIFG